MEDQTYDVVAKLPAGAAQEEFRGMLQRLLTERFHIEVAHESKSMTTYDLVVAKSGSKLTPSKFDKDAALAAKPPIEKRDAEGIPTLPPDAGPWRQFGVFGRQAVVLTNHSTVEHLTLYLSRNLKAPVNDRTGLQGFFEYRLHYEPEGLPPAPAAVPGPTMFGALESQLGLKLEEHKQSVDVLVVTKADRIPTPN